MSNKLVNPVTGQTVTVSDDRVAFMVEAGFEPADAAQVRSDVKDETDRAIAVEEFNTTGGAVASGLMGFADTASMGLLRPAQWNEAAELTTEANPTAAGIGKAAGIAAGMFIPTGGTAAVGAGMASRAVSGAGRALNIGGELAAKVVGGTGARAIAARGAIEGATYGGLDWMGSVIHGDPASVEGLVSQVGLGTIIGGGIGALAGRAAAKADVQRTVAEGIDTAATRFGEEQGAKHAAKVVQKAAKERGPLEKMVVEAQDEYYGAGARMSAADAGLGKAYGEAGELASKQRAAAAAQDAEFERVADEMASIATPVRSAQDELTSYASRLTQELDELNAAQVADDVASGRGAAIPAYEQKVRTDYGVMDQMPTADQVRKAVAEMPTGRELSDKLKENISVAAAGKKSKAVRALKRDADRLRIELEKIGAGKVPPEMQSRVDDFLTRAGVPPKAPEVPPPAKEFNPDDDFDFDFMDDVGPATAGSAATDAATSARFGRQAEIIRKLEQIQEAQQYLARHPGAKPFMFEAPGTGPVRYESPSFKTATPDDIGKALGDIQRFQAERLSTLDADVAGPVLRARAELGSSISNRFGIKNDNLDSLLHDGILAAYTRVSDKMRRWTPDPGRAVREARSELMSAAGSLEQAHTKLSERGKLLQELDEDIARRSDEVFRKQSLGAREGYLNKVVQEGEVDGGKQGGWFTRLIARRFGASFGAQLAGWHFGGPTGWMVLNRLFDKTATKTAGEAVSITRRQIMETARLKATLLDKSSKRLIKTSEVATRLSPRAMREDFEATRDHIANMAVSADALGFRAGDEMRTFAPGVADMLHETIMRGLNHLAETMPKDPGTMVEWAPTEMEMRAWGNRVEAVFRPMQALEKVVAGAGTAEHIQSLRAVYPNLVSQVAMSLSDIDPRTLSPNKRLAFSLLTGMPASAHYDPKTVSGIQARMAAQRQQQPAQSGTAPSGRPAPTAVGNSNATMADRVTER